MAVVLVESHHHPRRHYDRRQLLTLPDFNELCGDFRHEHAASHNDDLAVKVVVVAGGGDGDKCCVQCCDSGCDVCRHDSS